MVVETGGFDRTSLLELAGAGACGAVIVQLPGEGADLSRPGMVRIGVHRQGPRPMDGLDEFDILLSTDADAPRPWVGLEGADLDGTLERLQTQISLQPTAAAICAQVLRATLALSFEQALVLESLGYSLLLASEGFRAWRAANPVRLRGEPPEPAVLVEGDGRGLSIRLNRPERRNAFNARLRDELCEALAFALAHPDVPAVILSGEGPVFSAGGDLDEFGAAGDPGQAHLIRTLRSPARMVRALGLRAEARLHGACIGAGIEVPAAAARVTARRGAFFRLPEVGMGLIPGAGGTATIARRIGRRRACYMALSGADVDLDTALGWGLVDAEDET